MRGRLWRNRDVGGENAVQEEKAAAHDLKSTACRRGKSRLSGENSNIQAAVDTQYCVSYRSGSVHLHLNVDFSRPVGGLNTLAAIAGDKASKAESLEEGADAEGCSYAP